MYIIISIINYKIGSSSDDSSPSNKHSKNRSPVNILIYIIINKLYKFIYLHELNYLKR